MKKIDAHAHIGDFGSWAGVDGSPEQLIAFMDEYEIEQTVLCAKDHTGNEGVAEAAACYPGRFIPLVYLNPLEGADICRENDPHGSRTRRLHRRRAQDGKALPEHLS